MTILKEIWQLCYAAKVFACDNGKMAEKDEVDRIVAAWQRERPDLDFSAMHVFSRVGRLAKQLDLQRQAAFEATGLDIWEFDVLSSLRKAGEPYQVSIKTLVSENLVSSGTMTNRINRLTERGLVVRNDDPNDGRGILVQMTEQGRERVDRAIHLLVNREAELLHRFSAKERTEMTAMLRKLGMDFS